MSNIELISFRKADEHPKGWGKEVWITNNSGEGDFPKGYSGKFLVYDKQNAKSSMHFHTLKHETFYIAKGEFTIWYYNPDTADLLHEDVREGDVVVIPPHNPHQVVLNSHDGVIVEFATCDNGWDNFRIGKGDSQTNGPTMLEPAYAVESDMPEVYTKY